MNPSLWPILAAGVLVGLAGKSRFTNLWPYLSCLSGLASAAWLAWAQWGTPTSWLAATLALLAATSAWTMSQALRSLKQLGRAESLLGFSLRLSFLLPIVSGVLVTLWGLANWGVSHSALCLAGLQCMLVLLWLIATETSLQMRSVFVLLCLLAGYGLEQFQPSSWEEEARPADPVVLVCPTPWQRILMTRQGPELRLYRDGQMRLTNLDQHRYFESLVHPALSRQPQARRVAVLGGGDGLAARQILAHPQIQEIILVDPDEKASQLFRTNPALNKLNQNSLSNPKVHLESIDPMLWVRRPASGLDCIFLDFPDPSNESLAKLYSVGFFQALRMQLKPDGLLAMQATSSRFAPQTYGTILTSIQRAGFVVTPYQAYIPSLGEWGFALASQGALPPAPNPLPADLQYLSGLNTSRLLAFPKDHQPVWGPPNHFHHPLLPELFLDEVARKP